MRIASIPKNSSLALCSFDTELGTITCAASGGALSALWMSGQRFFGYPFGISEAEATSPADLSSANGLRAWTLDGSTVSSKNAAILEQVYQWTQEFLAGTNPNPSTIPLATYGTDFQLRVWNALLDISLIVPCHRVASASGEVHYGGGPARKLYLLSLESGEASAICSATRSSSTGN